MILLAMGAALTITGWVSDAHCGAEHTKPGGEICVRRCIAGGESINPEWKPQRMVIVADKDGKIWTVGNPAALKGQEGEHIEVVVRLDAAKKSLRVEKLIR